MARPETDEPTPLFFSAVWASLTREQREPIIAAVTESVALAKAMERDRVHACLEARLAEAIERRELERRAHPLVRTARYDQLQSVVAAWEQAVACTEVDP